jgi:adenylylsulfate kinase
MKDSHARSVVKGITWRMIASSTTMLLVWLFTGNLALVASVGALEIAAKLALYYTHERLWGAVRWGRLGPEPALRRKPVQKRL